MKSRNNGSGCNGMKHYIAVVALVVFLGGYCAEIQNAHQDLVAQQESHRTLKAPPGCFITNDEVEIVAHPITKHMGFIAYAEYKMKTDLTNDCNQFKEKYHHLKTLSTIPNILHVFLRYVARCFTLPFEVASGALGTAFHEFIVSQSTDERIWFLLIAATALLLYLRCYHQDRRIAAPTMESLMAEFGLMGMPPPRGWAAYPAYGFIGCDGYPPPTKVRPMGLPPADGDDAENELV
jgi:hypothetical protein